MKYVIYLLMLFGFVHFALYIGEVIIKMTIEVFVLTIISMMIIWIIKLRRTKRVKRRVS